MADDYVESIENVNAFLKEMKQILCREDFKMSLDLDIMMSLKHGTTGYKNHQTLENLDYDENNVRDELLLLTSSDYCATLPDRVDTTIPPFYLFNKSVNTKDIYIKMKIRDKTRRQVFIMSFHFPEFPLTKPYSK